MIVIDREDRRFNYRVAAVAIEDGRLLVHRAEWEEFWTLPGGRAEIGETAEQTLKREMQEELGASVEIIRPLWFVESFFEYDGKDWHEIGLYFLMRFLDRGPIIVDDGPFVGEDAGVRLLFDWTPLEATSLSALPLLPAFLQNRVDSLPAALEHIVHCD